MTDFLRKPWIVAFLEKGQAIKISKRVQLLQRKILSDSLLEVLVSDGTNTIRSVFERDALNALRDEYPNLQFDGGMFILGDCEAKYCPKNEDMYLLAQSLKFVAGEDNLPLYPAATAAKSDPRVKEIILRHKLLDQSRQNTEGNSTTMATPHSNTSISNPFKMASKSLPGPSYKECIIPPDQSDILDALPGWDFGTELNSHLIGSPLSDHSVGSDLHPSSLTHLSNSSSEDPLMSTQLGDFHSSHPPLDLKECSLSPPGNRTQLMVPLITPGLTTSNPPILSFPPHLTNQQSPDPIAELHVYSTQPIVKYPASNLCLNGPISARDSQELMISTNQNHSLPQSELIQPVSTSPSQSLDQPSVTVNSHKTVATPVATPEPTLSFIRSIPTIATLPKLKRLKRPRYSMVDMRRDNQPITTPPHIRTDNAKRVLHSEPSKLSHKHERKVEEGKEEEKEKGMEKDQQKQVVMNDERLSKSSPALPQQNPTAQQQHIHTPIRTPIQPKQVNTSHSSSIFNRLSAGLVYLFGSTEKKKKVEEKKEENERSENENETHQRHAGNISSKDKDGLDRQRRIHDSLLKSSRLSHMGAVSDGFVLKKILPVPTKLLFEDKEDKEEMGEDGNCKQSEIEEVKEAAGEEGRERGTQSNVDRDKPHKADSVGQPIELEDSEIYYSAPIAPSPLFTFGSVSNTISPPTSQMISSTKANDPGKENSLDNSEKFFVPIGGIDITMTTKNNIDSEVDTETYRDTSTNTNMKNTLALLPETSTGIVASPTDEKNNNKNADSMVYGKIKKKIQEKELNQVPIDLLNSISSLPSHPLEGPPLVFSADRLDGVVVQPGPQGDKNNMNGGMVGIGREGGEGEEERVKVIEQPVEDNTVITEAKINILSTSSPICVEETQLSDLGGYLDEDINNNTSETRRKGKRDKRVDDIGSKVGVIGQKIQDSTNRMAAKKGRNGSGSDGNSHGLLAPMTNKEREVKRRKGDLIGKEITQIDKVTRENQLNENSPIKRVKTRAMVRSGDIQPISTDYEIDIMPAQRHRDDVIDSESMFSHSLTYTSAKPQENPRLQGVRDFF
eukprot:Ihof_evm2s373 gene=Ihof_evmTU2s373